jgi:hypothetical protein
MYLSINPPPSINRPPSHGFSSHGFSTSQRLPATPLAPHPGRANFQGPAAAVALEPRRPGGPRRPCLGTDGTEHGCRAMSCVVDDLCISMLYTHNMHIYIHICDWEYSMCRYMHMYIYIANLTENTDCINMTYGQFLEIHHQCSSQTGKIIPKKTLHCEV